MEMLGFYLMDPKFFLYVAPAILLAIWAQMKVKSAYAQASRLPASSRLSGAEAAQRILNHYGISNVSIEAAKSFLGDHYDPRHKVLRLSPEVYRGRSLASLGIAAHEVGHAIQDARAYGPLAIRNGLVPMASIGSNFAVILIIAGLVLSTFVGAFGQTLAVVGLGLFGVVVLFQLINLPVEFNASSRAREILLANGMVTAAENRVVGKVLNAAALTYVAATATAVLTMLYYASLVLGRRH
ncbi:MAG: zinc metallopeptidase [Planctomycetota bacterium]|jgi:Zn-dependent membrane protease YugP